MYPIKEIQTHHITIHVHALKWNDFFFTFCFYMFMNNFEVLIHVLLFLLQVYFGTFQSRNCLSANSVGINCSTGMSCLFRKDILEKSGGLAPLGKYLAEDYFISENIRKE